MNFLLESVKLLLWIIVVFQMMQTVEMSDGEVTKVNVTENGTVTLLCNHGKDESGINAIVWEDTNEKTVAELTYNNNGKLKKVRNEMEGRVTISFPEGDLILSDVSRIDRGNYKCVVIHRGLRHDSNKWHLLNVLVPPEKLTIKCSGTTTGNPDEDCSIIKKDQIKAIQCEVVSNPVSNLVWSEKASGCSPKANGGTVKVEYDLHKKVYRLNHVCQGTYCCQAHYEVDGILQTDSVCVNIGDVGQGSTAGSLTEKDNIWQWALIAVVAILVVTFLIFIFCICFCICYRRRNKKYPCGLKRLPCFHMCCGKNGKQHELNINIVKVHDNGVDNNTALTPFLGPNHVAPTQGNVFTFVVNEAQDNPKVNRVKVTQDHDPAGDKSRTVEIYKTREDTALLPSEEEQNIHVQPSLFRRALSNSDVSKIIYTETVDDIGRVKREIDIIKGYPADEKEKEEVEDDYLQSAAGVSLSPTGAAYSMNSMQRKRSKLPATSSETDVRRPVLQRQLTIERSSHNSRNLVYQQSQSIEFDNLPSPSIDLDEVD